MFPILNRLIKYFKQKKIKNNYQIGFSFQIYFDILILFLVAKIITFRRSQKFLKIK
jgi:hypothetical protein